MRHKTRKGILAGTMRYFQAKVYFKSERAPEHLFLPNQFHKCSNSVPVIGQKKHFSEFEHFLNWFSKNKCSGALPLLK